MINTINTRPYSVSAIPISLIPNVIRRYSDRAIVSAVPIVGPSSVYIPPNTATMTMRHETPMPETVSGDIGYVLSVQDAAQRGQPGRQGGDGQLEPRHVDPHGGGCRFVFPDRLQRGSGHAAVQPLPDGQARDPQHDRCVVEDALIRK